MNLAIVGSRSLNLSLDKFITEIPDKIITGDAYGIDRCARNFAVKNQIDLKVFSPDYSRYGKSAPIIRNIEIINECDKVIALWDGKSNGTSHVINLAKRKHKELKIFVLENRSSSVLWESNNQLSFL